MPAKNSKIFYFLVVSILMAGIFFRFWELGSVPPGIQYDEAYNGINAIQALETGDYKIFYPENTGREGLHINVIAFFIKIFGASSFSLRFANALWGSLTLIGFYFLLRELKLSKLSALLGIFMLAFSFWHLDFSRTAFRAIMVPFCLVWSLYFFLKGINSSNKKLYIFFILAGFFLGLGFYSYIAFRVAPLVFILFGIVYVCFEKKWLANNWKSVLVFIFAAIFCALPILFYFSSHFNDFWTRSQSVSVFNSAKLSAGQALLKSLGVHLQAFFAHGDNNPRHNYNNQPLIPAGWVAFFVLGFIISVKEIAENIWQKIKFKKELEEEKEFKLSGLFYPSVLAQSIFWVMLAPGILSIEGIPHSLRIIGTIPGVFLFCILPIEYILKIYRKMRDSSDVALRTRGTNLTLTFILGLAAVIIISGFLQVYVYFGLWANDLRTAGGFERKLYLMGILIKDLDAHKNNYVITAYNTAIYENGKTSSLKTTEYIAYPKIKNYLFYRPMDGLKNVNCDDIQIVFQESDQWLRDQYRAKCPNLQTDKYSFNKNKYIFYVMSPRE